MAAASFAPMGFVMYWSFALDSLFGHSGDWNHFLPVGAPTILENAKPKTGVKGIKIVSGLSAGTLCPFCTFAN